MVHMENQKAIGYDYDSLNDPTTGNKENVKRLFDEVMRKVGF